MHKKCQAIQFWKIKQIIIRSNKIANLLTKGNLMCFFKKEGLDDKVWNLSQVEVGHEKKAFMRKVKAQSESEEMKMV